MGGFTACDDVPAPYGIDDTPEQGGGDEPGTELKDIFTAEFDTDACGFTFDNVNIGSLSFVWKQDAYNGKGYLKASAFANNTSNAAEAWAISPAINLSDCTKATLSFRHAINKIDAELIPGAMTVWVSTDKENWEQLQVPNYPEGTSWTFIDAGEMDITKYAGKQTIYIGFKYISTNEASGTWEVDAFKITGDGTPMEGGEENPDQPEGDILLEEAFSTTLGSFTNVTTSGEGAWTIDFKTAKASGYDNASKVTTDGCYYLVSPEVSLTDVTEAHLSYEYILQYNQKDENQQVLIIESSKYNAANASAGWTLLNQTHVAGLRTEDGKTDWSTFTTADLNIPTEFLGKNIRVAFRYNCENQKGSTWEVKNLKLAKGKASEGGDTPGEGGGDNPGEGGGDIVDGEKVSYTFAELGSTDAELSTMTIADNITLTFNKNEGSNQPKYFKNGNCARMYAKNSLTITAQKTIAQVIAYYDVYNGQSYFGNPTLYAQANGENVEISKDEASQMLVFNVNDTSLNIVNEHTENKGGTQLRIKKLEIIYAK